jgi:hypothetical protein
MAVHIVLRIFALGLVALACAQANGDSFDKSEIQQRFLHRQSFFEHGESMGRGGQQLPHALLQEWDHMHSHMQNGVVNQNIPGNNPFFTHQARADHSEHPWDHVLFDDYASQNRLNGWTGQDHGNRLHDTLTPEEQILRRYSEQHHDFDKQTKSGEKSRWALTSQPEHLEHTAPGREDFHRTRGWASRDVSEKYQHGEVPGERGGSERLRKFSQGHTGMSKLENTHEAGKAEIRQFSQVILFFGMVMCAMLFNQLLEINMWTESRLMCCCWGLSTC